MEKLFKESLSLDDRIHQALASLRQHADREARKAGRLMLVAVRITETSAFALYLLDGNGTIRHSQKIRGVPFYVKPEREELRQAYGELLETQQEIRNQAVTMGLSSNPSEIVLCWISFWRNPANERLPRHKWIH